jgi:hypothetical protein
VRWQISQRVTGSCVTVTGKLFAAERVMTFTMPDEPAHLFSPALGIVTLNDR